MLKKNKYSEILPHILFWLFSIVLFTVVLFYTRDFSLQDIDLKTAINILVTIFLLSISVYINLLWLIPVYFRKRKFFLFSVLQSVNILLFIVLNYYISVLFEGNGHPNFITEAIAEFILVLIFLVVSSLLKFVRDSFALQDIELKIKESEQQQMEAELKALKAQVNPHFFFNTLNSLYSLTIDKSDKAPELILKLSELMRYVIYEAKEDFEPIERQLEFVKSYVYLESLRVGDYLKVDLRVEGDNISLKVAPLIFIAFVENAFKHCSKQIQQKPFISIVFDIGKKDRIRFYIENTKENKIPDMKLPETGIGLQNVRKRLSLLYPGKHDLEIKVTDQKYSVDLTIFPPT
jgi:two-component system LytT family sensor kinase